MDKVSRPSGSELPLLLRRRLRDQQGLESVQIHGSIESSPAVNTQEAVKTISNLRKTSLSSDDKNRIFTAEELEERIWKTTVAMVEVQKQIFKGEETYVTRVQLMCCVVLSLLILLFFCFNVACSHT